MSVELGAGWLARCRVVPLRGRYAIAELHVAPTDAACPLADGLTISRIRELRVTDVLAEVGRRKPSHTVDELLAVSRPQGKRRRDEGILATVAILYEEAVAAGSRHPARHVSEALDEMHEISSADDWPWNRYRKYKRSSVRTLIREARERGYLLGDSGHPRLVDDSAQATTSRAVRRGG